MSSINKAAQDLLSAAFGTSNAANLISTFQNSPTLVNLLNNFSNTPVSSIQLGAPGKVTLSSSTVITIDPNMLPWVPTGESVATFATTLGHELGHATQPGCIPSFQGLTSAAAAVQNGDNAEGVALTQEYKVAQELGVIMHSGSMVQSLIDTAVRNDTAGSAQYNSDAKAAGAAWTASQYPSVAAGAVTPTASNPSGGGNLFTILRHII